MRMVAIDPYTGAEGAIQVWTSDIQDITFFVRYKIGHL